MRLSQLLGQQFHLGEGTGEWRSKFMGAVGGEVAFGLYCVFQACEQGVHRARDRCDLCRQTIERDRFEIASVSRADSVP